METEIEIKLIFISGPVSAIIKERGYLAAVLDFENAETRINAKYPDAQVVNPMKVCKADWSWLRCMIRCLYELFFCDTICMMPGWRDSKGSRIEHRFARRWHLNILRIFKKDIVVLIKREEYGHEKVD